MRRNVFAVRAMARSVKLRVYAASVLSVLLYGSETWNLTAVDTKRLESFHNRCLRCMFGISRLTHFTNFDLRKLTGQRTIESMIMTNRLRWLGHVMRMPEERMPKKMIFGQLQTARPAGGTRQRWKDCVQHDLRAMGLEDGWSILAQQRDKWHAATEKAISKWEAERNEKEKEAYEEKKSGAKIKCPYCPYMAKNEKGLKLHFGHKHKFVADLSEDDSEPDEAQPRSSSSSSSSSSTTATAAGKRSSRTGSTTSKPTGSTTTTRSNFTCSKCGKDCTTGAGLASHLRHSKNCKAATDPPK